MRYWICDFGSKVVNLGSKGGNQWDCVAEKEDVREWEEGLHLYMGSRKNTNVDFTKMTTLGLFKQYRNSIEFTKEYINKINN